MKPVWQHAEKLAALGALVLAIPAFVLSTLSYNTAQRALDLSEQDFRAARSLVLKGDYNAESRKIRWTPLGEGITLQTCTIILPPSLTPASESAMPPNFEMKAGELEQRIQWAVDKLEKPRGPMIVSFPDRMFPVIVESVYLAKGEVRQARSVYDITFDVTFFSDRRPKIDLKGTLFVSDAPTLPAQELDSLWNQQLDKMRPSLESVAH